jgi:hypothetical protein
VADQLEEPVLLERQRAEKVERVRQHRDDDGDRGGEQEIGDGGAADANAWTTRPPSREGDRLGGGCRRGSGSVAHVASLALAGGRLNYPFSCAS